MAAGELIVSIIGDMKALSKTFQKVQSDIGNVGKRFQDVGKSMSSAGASMTAGITAPILAFAAAGAGAVLWGSEILQSQGKIQVSLGVTAAEADKLKEAGMNVWKNGFGENIDAVNQAIISVRQNMGDLAGQELESVTAGAITISKVFGEDVNEVTAAAGVLMKNFGIDGQHALDIITAGYQQGGDFSKELLDTLREYAPQFKAMGVSADEFLAILISGAQAGAWNLDKVADAVKEFNIRAQDGSDTTMKGFAAIGLSADEMGQKIAAGGDSAKEAFMATVAGLMAMEDPVERNIAGVALFGTQWEDVKAQVIDATASGIKNVKDVAGATSSAAKDVAASNPMQELINISREVQAEFLPVVEDQIIPLLRDDLVPILRDTLIPVLKEYIIPTIAAVASAFGDLPKPVQVVILAVTAFLAALGPILVVIGSIVSAVGTLTAVFGAGGALAGVVTWVSATLLPALGTALATLLSPIGLVVAAVALLALAWKNNWFDIQGKAKAVWDWLKTQGNDLKNQLERAWHAIVMSVATLKTQFSAAWDAIKNAYSTIAGMIVSTGTGLYNGLKSVYNMIVSAIVTLVNSWRSHWMSFQSATQVAANTVNSILTTLYNYVNIKFNQLRTAAQTILNNWRTHWSTFQGATSSAANTINNILSTLYNNVNSRFNQIRTAAQNLLSQWRTHWSTFQSATSSASSSLGSTLSSMYSNVQSRFNSIRDSANNLMNNWRTTWNNIVSAAKSAGSQLVSAISGLPVSIRNLSSAFGHAGQVILDALYDSIVNGFKKAIKKAKDMLAELRSYLPSSPAEQGPFKKLPNWSSAISQPLNKSVNEAASTAKKAGTSILGNISSSLKSAATTLYNSAKNTYKKLKSLIPHSPAEEGPFSEIPNWDSIFYDPLKESITRSAELAKPLTQALSGLRSPIDSLSGGLGQVAAVTNNSYAGDSITIGPNNLANGVDVRMLIEELNRYTANKRRSRGLFS